MKNNFFILHFALILGIASCNSSSKSNGSNTINTSIAVEEFEKRITEAKTAQLIDVRTPEEFAEGHLKGALNYNINSDDFENQITSLDKKQPVFVYCLSGGRSSSAADLLSEKGFTQVYNMSGGIMKWNAANKPIEAGVSENLSKGITLDEFLKMINSEKYVLVDYNATWCKPCKIMAPMLDKIAENNKDKLIFVKIDADKNKSLLKEKGIESIPVLELYKNGIKVWEHEGEIDEATLLKETKL
jgi:thioredoxin